MKMEVKNFVLILSLLVAHAHCYSQPITLILCEGMTRQFSCHPGTVIQMMSAVYGRSNGITCPHSATSNTSCGDPGRSLSIMQSRCDGINECQVPITNGVFTDPCEGTYKYLRVTYECVSAE